MINVINLGLQVDKLRKDSRSNLVTNFKNRAHAECNRDLYSVDRKHCVYGDRPMTVTDV